MGQIKHLGTEHLRVDLKKRNIRGDLLIYKINNDNIIPREIAYSISFEKEFPKKAYATSYASKICTAISP